MTNHSVSYDRQLNIDKCNSLLTNLIDETHRKYIRTNIFFSVLLLTYTLWRTMCTVQKQISDDACEVMHSITSQKERNDEAMKQTFIKKNSG